MTAARLEPAFGLLGIVLLVVVPTAVHGWPTTAAGTLGIGLVLVGGVALLWWRRRPRVAAVGALTAFLAAALTGAWVPDPATALFSVAFAVLALGWSGRAAWVIGLCAVAYVLVFYRATDMGSPVAATLFTAPLFAAGTVLRLRRETADQLALRACELEEERELFAEIAVRHERARIAGELHDVVGHAISVMVIQAAAGQRLVDSDPGRARAAFAAIADSARQGTRDLERLVALLGGADVEAGTPDLSLVDEVVARAGESGLDVTCRFEGDRARVPPPHARVAFRVVQEGLTNALRHAPGTAVRVAIRLDEADRALAVRVENDASDRTGPALLGTGRGLVGLRERVRALGGTLTAGPARDGGWALEARLPALVPADGSAP